MKTLLVSQGREVDAHLVASLKQEPAKKGGIWPSPTQRADMACTNANPPFGPAEHKWGALSCSKEAPDCWEHAPPSWDGDLWSFKMETLANLQGFGREQNPNIINGTFLEMLTIDIDQT